MFVVLFTGTSRKQYYKLVRGNVPLRRRLERLVIALTTDPLNLSGQYDITKLTDVRIGLYRIRSGDYRIRYDIDKSRVYIVDVFHRKEGY